MQAPVLVTVCLAFFMAPLDTTILNIAGPDLQQRLGASLDQALWGVNSYTLTFAVPAHDVRPTRRPLRPPDGVPRRAGVLHRQLGPVRRPPRAPPN
jgi:MFS family permease